MYVLRTYADTYTCRYPLLLLTHHLLTAIVAVAGHPHEFIRTYLSYGAYSWPHLPLINLTSMRFVWIPGGAAFARTYTYIY